MRFRIVENGKEINKNLSPFPTKKQAQEAYLNFMATYVPSEIVDSPNMKFGELANNYLKYLKGRAKDTSYYDMEKRVQGKMLPYFKNYEIRKIKPIDILKWQESLANYSYTYRMSIRSQLSSIFKFGVKYCDLPFNPIERVDTPKNQETKKEMLIWSIEEFNRFISCVNKPDYKMFFTFLYYTGCRKGEALALTWKDIDLKKETIKISKSISNKTTGNEPFVITTPKNRSSNREISIAGLTLQLAEYKKWQSSECSENKFVFGGSRPFPTTNIDRELAHGIVKSGVKKIRVHDFRHSHCSFLISNGVSIVAVAKRLGHSNIEQTLNTYAHLLPKDDEQIKSILQKTLEQI